MNGDWIEIVRSGSAVVVLAAATSGCVMASSYNSMLQQQQAIETALRSEIASDQVYITQVTLSLLVLLSSALLSSSGSTELSPPVFSSLY